MPKTPAPVAPARPKKSARKSAPGRPFTGADDPRRGRGPKKGAPNAGRPRIEHIEWCQHVLSDKKVEAAVVAILRDSTHAQFSNLWGRIADRGYGRGQEEVDVTHHFLAEVPPVAQDGATWQQQHGPSASPRKK